MLSSKELLEVKELLSSQKKIVILPHYNADGDAVGSTTALRRVLQNMGQESVEVVSANDFPKFLKWIPGAKKITIADRNIAKAHKFIKEAELLFLLDFNTLSRINHLEEVVGACSATKILIDHHQQPQEFDFVFSDTSYPATCQMLYDFIESMGLLENLDSEAATSLYVGILTDTGGFKYPTTSHKTLQIAAKLIEKSDFKPHEINDLLFDSSSVSRLRLLNDCLSSMKLLPESKTVHFHITRKQMQDKKHEKGDTDGFVNYGLTLKGYDFSVIFLEDMKHDFIKISFRSKGDVDVNKFARKHFSGGGHKNAAGGKSDLNMEETIKRFEEIVIQNNNI